MRSYNVVIFFINSFVVNRYFLKVIFRVGVGFYEFYDFKFKFKWEDKVSFMVLSLNLIGNLK